MNERWISVFFVVAAAVSFLYFRVRHRHLTDEHARRIAARLEVYVAGAFLWPGIVLYICSPSAEGKELYFVAAVLVLAYLTQEVGVLYAYCGPLRDFDPGDLFYQRSTQVSTVAFALGTILMSQKDDNLARGVTPLLFLGLALCVFSSVPSASVRKRADSSATINALQKLTVSYSAGILCLAVAYCLSPKDLRLA